MDLYHSWFYVNILNTEWFVWTIVYLVLGFNIIAPILLWLIMSGKKLPFKGKKKKQNVRAN